jgi:hypothetical protein
MSPSAMASQIAKILADDPALAFEFYCMASEIVDDFDDWGPTIQANENGVYDETTVIAKLRALRNEIIFRRDGYRPK